MKQTNYSFHISGIQSQFVQRRVYSPYYVKPLKTLKFTHMHKYVSVQVHTHTHTHTQFFMEF